MFFLIFILIESGLKSCCGLFVGNQANMQENIVKISAYFSSYTKHANSYAQENISTEVHRNVGQTSIPVVNGLDTGRKRIQIKHTVSNTTC